MPSQKETYACASCIQPPVTNYQLPATSYQLPATATTNKTETTNGTTTNNSWNVRLDGRSGRNLLFVGNGCLRLCALMSVSVSVYASVAVCAYAKLSFQCQQPKPLGPKTKPTPTLRPVGWLVYGHASSSQNLILLTQKVTHNENQRAIKQNKANCT